MSYNEKALSNLKYLFKNYFENYYQINRIKIENDEYKIKKNEYMKIYLKNIREKKKILNDDPINDIKYLFKSYNVLYNKENYLKKKLLKQ